MCILHHPSRRTNNAILHPTIHPSIHIRANQDSSAGHHALFFSFNGTHRRTHRPHDCLRFVSICICVRLCVCLRLAYGWIMGWFCVRFHANECWFFPWTNVRCVFVAHIIFCCVKQWKYAIAVPRTLRSEDAHSGDALACELADRMQVGLL